MKKRLLTTAIALLGAALIPAAHASPTTYTTGDIILGFETTGGNFSLGATENLLIDLGQYSNLGSFSSINLTADLNTAFGSGNWSSGQISYGALGVTLSGVNWSTVYESVGAGNNLANLAAGNTSVRNDYAVLTSTTGIGYQNLSVNVPASWTGYGVDGSSTASGAWGTYLPGASAFGVTGNNLEAAIGSNLALYSAGRNVNSGTFASTGYTISVNSSGALSVSAVPEPSTYALFGFGSLLLIVAYRRSSGRRANS